MDLEYEAHKLRLELIRQTSELELELTRKTNELAQLQRVAEENKFMLYYDYRVRRQFGVEALRESLGRWVWLPDAYRLGIFDCSEMSTYIERRLELEGFRTVIVIGDSPFGIGRHAWLLVETRPGIYTPVEPTAYRIVEWYDRYFLNYFRYEQKFECIREALAYSYEEFNWWGN